MSHNVVVGFVNRNLILIYFSENIGLKMAELENKIKKEADIREEALLKRISEKDKQIAKMKYEVHRSSVED